MADDVVVEDLESLHGDSGGAGAGSRPSSAAGSEGSRASSTASGSRKSTGSKRPGSGGSAGKPKGSPKGVEVFCRVRPLPDGVPLEDNTAVKVDAYDNIVSLYKPVDRDNGKAVNNTRQYYKFPFSTMFPSDAPQEKVFEKVVGRSVIGVLDGYNATVFAYGQTGSGKTWTITGGKRYSERGLIPRALSKLFEEMKQRTDTVYQCHVSYMEIYQETVYDLLNTENDGEVLEDLPVVTLREDKTGELNFINLQKHMATNEEEALNVLFLGDTNRTIAETAMNEASSRSHCIFTIYVDARKEGKDMIRRSKLHVVDLAGSERIGKSLATGQTQKEAIAINGSLFNLERVIMSLGKKSVTHIPYRDSKITSVLRDSLGGNCLTTMIATISLETRHVPESISTCKFAARVGRIKNTALINEEMDPKLAVIALNQRVEQLKNELLLASADDDPDAPITEEDEIECQGAVSTYLEDPSEDSYLSVDTKAKVRRCFAIMKEAVLKARKEAAEGGGAGGKMSAKQQEHVKQIIAGLRSRLAERERELEVIKNIMREQKKLAAEQPKEEEKSRKPPAAAQRSSNTLEPSTQKRRPHSGPQETSATASAALRENHGGVKQSASADTLTEATAVASPRSVDSTPLTSPKITGRQKNGSKKNGSKESKKEAFREFSKSYPDARILEDNSKLLRKKLLQAKNLSTACRGLAQKVNEYRARIEQIRMQAVMEKGDSKDGEEEPQKVEPSDAEKKALARLEQCSAKYKEFYAALAEVRTDVGRLEALTKQEKKQLLADFERWYRVMNEDVKPVEESGSDATSEVFSVGSNESSGPSSKGSGWTDASATTETGGQNGHDVNDVDDEVDVSNDPEVQAFYRKLNAMKGESSDDKG